MREKLKILILSSLLLSWVGCRAPQPNEIVARVAGEEITVRDLIQAIYREGDKFGEIVFKNSERFQEVKRKLLDDLIQKKILMQEATKEGISISEEELEKEIRNYKSRYTERDFQKILEKRKIDYSIWKEIKKANLMTDRFLERKVFSNITIPEEKMRSYYQEHFEGYTIPESVHIRQIVTDTQEKAETILKRLKEGENFARVAHDLSLSPDRVRGGDLGFIQKGSFPKEFDLCFSLKVGELSPIVSSLYGFHIFKVIERRSGEKASYQEIREQIEEWLKEEAKEELFQSYYQNLLKKYPIEINQSVLKKVVI